MTLAALYSTVPADAIAAVVAEDYGLGDLASAHFHSRGNNDIYLLRTASGVRYAARLSHRRKRGPNNVAYETALLAHLSGQGAPVAAAVPARDGRLWRMLDAAEGEREFAVFTFLPGRQPGADDESAGIVGETLAAVLAAARGFARDSLYQRDLEDVLHGPARRLAATPYLNDALRAQIGDVERRAADALAGRLEGLTWQICHGDIAPVNCHIAAGADGVKRGGLIDFEAAAPAWLGYEIGHFLFHIVRFGEPGAYTDDQRRRWAAFLEGMNRVAPVSAADVAAAHAFLPIRWIAWGAFFADRLEDWGAANLQPAWLSGQVKQALRWLESDPPAL